MVTVWLIKMATKYVSPAEIGQQPATEKHLFLKHRRKLRQLRLEGDVRNGNYPKTVNSRSQSYDNIKDTKGKETACQCPVAVFPKASSQLRIDHKQSLTKELPLQHEITAKSCLPEYVHPRSTSSRHRRPTLPEPPEMLSYLKQGIRNPYQITLRRKEIQTYLEKLTDEHQAFAFPPGTKSFVDTAYYFINPPPSVVENYVLIQKDTGTEQFLECTIKPPLLVFNRDEYKFFRERLTMPQKRILDIPGNRATHWHSWIVRPLHTTYSASWRRDLKVPDNWFGPPLLKIQ